jgi:hypothetical protein
LPDERPLIAELRGRTFKLVDKYETRNSVNVGMNARRFELKEVTQP